MTHQLRQIGGRRPGKAVKRLLVIGAQLGALILINKVGYVAMKALHVPLPGNLLGMLFLFVLLRSGLVRQEWLQATSSILTRHLAFFFIPITVGLMGFSRLLMDSGVAIVVSLLTSAGIGICACGMAAQTLAHRLERGNGSDVSLERREATR